MHCFCNLFFFLSCFILQEEIKDLLSKDHNKKLELKERPDTGIYVKVRDVFDVICFLWSLLQCQKLLKSICQVLLFLPMHILVENIKDWTEILYSF